MDLWTDFTLNTDSVSLVGTASAAFQVTLPTAVGIAGRQDTNKRTYSGSNNVTVGCTGAETIDGATTKILGAQHSAITLVSNGAIWAITGQIGTGS